MTRAHLNCPISKVRTALRIKRPRVAYSERSSPLMMFLENARGDEDRGRPQHPIELPMMHQVQRNVA
jgi:hypothetical protein